jgi:putative cardiolipin synthase
MARYAFAALAEKTIDAQYYLWEEDTTGRILFSALMKAASRGVRVRLLLDDLNTVGKDYALAILTAHPNIQVRLYNPFIERSFRGWDALFNFVRINHRMHNKAFIVDNVVAIVGGRNIGDNYFAVDEQSNFRDLDLFAGGPIVHDVSESFDAFWNSAWALPVQAFVNGQPTLEQFHKLAAALDTTAVDYKNLPFPLETDPEALTAFAKNVPARLIWGEATVLADRPDKPSTAESEVLAGLRQKFGGTMNRELLLEVAYFVPGNRGVKSLCALTARGVRIRVLTNSFASNDVALVHAGYVKYRKELLRCGVELTELQPLAGFIRREWRWLKGKSKAALHTKAAVFDRHAVFIGSFNLDPRSASLNTELAIVVESPALATEVVRFIEAGMQPSNAYHVELDRHGGLQWTATEQGKTVHFTHEPHTTLWRSLIVKSLLLLPIEGQL